ncbi:MAG: ATP-binding protein, partial [Eggerthellaceae bacterium]|nr:ATP-binding protein [Eggerthellaceae bacterium]
WSSFSAIPTMFFGRAKYLEAAIQGLENPQSPYRAFFLVGTRGSGKTVLLHHIADLARERDWVSCEVHSSHAAERIGSQLGEAISRKRSKVSIAPKITLPDGTSASIFEAEHETRGNLGHRFLSETLQSACKSLKRKKGVLIAIDEVQKLSEEDAVEISNAVQSAKTQGFDVMLVMAGLPRSKERISSFGGCTFLKRTKEFVLKPLTRTETKEAFRSLFAKVPEIAVSTDQIDDMAHFSQGHPYLIQLVGHYIYERIDKLCGEELGKTIKAVPLGEAELASSKDEAYQTYREDVLVPVLDELGEATTAYLAMLVSTMNEHGIMESGKATAGAMSAASSTKTASTSYFRDRLIKLCVVQSAGRGKVKFLLPYIPRALAEKELEINIVDIDEDDWDLEV